MSAIANITVFDGAATPVSHTLVAESVSRPAANQVWATWKESLSGVPDYAQVRVSVKKTKSVASGVTKITTRVEVPVMESVSGVNAAGYTAAPKVAYVDTAEYTHYAHDRSLIAGRRSARQILANLMGNVSTSVVPVTTGPLPEAVDQLLMPT